MEKQYTEEECWYKAGQHWKMAGLARQDRDYKECDRHTKKAHEWEAKAKRIARGIE